MTHPSTRSSSAQDYAVQRRRALAWLRKTAPRWHGSAGYDDFESLVRALHSARGDLPLNDEEIEAAAFQTIVGWEILPAPLVRPANYGGDRLEALEARLEQLGSQRQGNGRWTCPAHSEQGKASLLVSRGKKRLRLKCFGGCPQARLLDRLGWTWRDLVYSERPSSATPTVSYEIDVFGQVHWQGVAEEAVLLLEGGTAGTATPKGEEKPLTRERHSSATPHPLATRLKSGEVPLSTGERPLLSDLEERQLNLDTTLRHGPLPANPSSERRATQQRALAAWMLRAIRTYAASGEYRALMVAGSRAAQVLGVSHTTAGKVLQDLVRAGTFGRQELSQYSVKRGVYVYTLPLSVAAHGDHGSPIDIKDVVGAVPRRVDEHITAEALP